MHRDLDRLVAEMVAKGLGAESVAVRSGYASIAITVATGANTITRMVEVSRAYESTAKMIDAESDLSRRSVERLGRVQ